jgi:tRNA A-37 threonylcarbamoyl transferase component Bud32
MSPGISILFMLLCGTSFLMRSDLGLAGFLCSNTASGLVARRAILLVVFLPVLFGLRFVLVHYKIVDNALGWAVFGLGALVLTIALVVTGVKSAEELMASAIRINPVELYDQSGLVSASMNANAGMSINLQGLPSASIFTRQPPALAGSASAVSGVAGVAGLGISGVSAPPASERIKKVCLACELEFSADNEVCPSCESVLTKMINKSLVGQIFADKYEVTWQLGDGGMASVYLAKHMYINQEVAIKVLHAALSGNLVDIKRFQQEGKALGSLNHPNIVAVRDFGFTTGGEAFLAMEYVKGTSLSDIIEKRKLLNVQETAQIVLQVCEALIHAHEAGIVHRDLKPSNIMCSPREGGGYEVKVVDFGLAKITGRDELDAIKLTQTGDCQGSPPYMSPEQCTAKPVDFRTDIYALGCILYECLAGKAPFIATSIYETLTMHVNNPPPNFPDWLVVPPTYRDMVMQALQKNPNKRQQSVDELRQVLLKLV